MAQDDPVVIIGAGLAGAAAAWAMSRRGLPVVVLEQFAAGHARGSSHGSARIVRRAYGDALYVSLTGRAFELWRELELTSGAQLLRMLGGLDFGPRRNVATVASLLAEDGVPHEVLPPGEAARRWPGMVFDTDVVFHPQAGTMDAAGAVTALLDQATGLGAVVHHSTQAATVADRRVVLTDGSVLAARCVVVAAGGWVVPLLSGVLSLPPITVTQQQVFHFPRRDPSAPPWPSVIHEPDENPVYHLAGGRDGGPGDDRKIGEHDGGHATTAATRDGVVDAESRARVIRYVERWLPGLHPTPRGEVTCLYTDTPSEDFVLDRIGDIVVCSPCSGHGAKFAPLIGEYVADLVTGAGTVPDRFRLAAHLTGRTASVSL
ncbi:MAG: sarcosine oxidase [Pseudonocardiales bacterium]|jgi:sarcosine oxidase|nr:sarcosine oxidase [Pseudonocardiales bacterium]